MTDMLSWLKSRLPWGADCWWVALMGFVMAAPAVFNGFTLDAGVDITQNQFVVEPGRLWQLLTSDYTAGGGLRSGFWRPLTGLLDWLLWRIGGGTTVPFFLFIAVFHSISSVAVYRLGQLWEAGRWASLIGALLFAVHPVHTDVLSGVVGLKDALSAMCFLLGLLAAVAAREQWRTDGGWARVWVAPLLYLVGLLAKESCIALPAAIAGIDLARRVWQSRPMLVRVATQYALFGLALLIKFGGQRVLLGATLEGITIQPADNPLILFPGVLGRLLSLALIPEVGRLLLWPLHLSPDYSYNVIPIPSSPVAPSVLVGAFVVAVCAYSMLRAAVRANHAIFGPLLVLCVSYLPVSNAVVTIGTLTAERFLYLPSAGFCLLAGIGLTRVVRRRTTLVIVTLSLLSLGAVRTVLRHRDWVSERTLWLAAYRVYPGGQKICHGAAFESLQAGDAAGAVSILNGALDYQDPSSRTEAILKTWRPVQLRLRAQAHAASGDRTAAARDYIAAIAERPDDKEWRDELSRLFAGPDSAAAAAETWQQLAELAKDEGLKTQSLDRAAGALSVVATSSRNAGDLYAAAKALERAVLLAPQRLDLRRNLAIVLSESKSWAAAERAWKQLIELDPNEPLNRFNLVLMLDEAGRRPEARKLAIELEARLPADHPLRTELSQRFSLP